MSRSNSSPHRLGRRSPWCAASTVAAVVVLVGTGGLSQQVDSPLELPSADAVKPELYATGFAFAEGPAFDRAGNLFAVNYRIKGTIGRITPEGEASIWCDLAVAAPLEGRSPVANGLKVDREQRLIVADAGGGRLLRVSADGQEVEVLADRFEGARFNSLNDVALDSRGNIYFTDPGGSTVESPTGVVYRYDIGTQKTARLAGGFAFCNGLGLTPDQRHLCVSESRKHRILIFDIDPAGVVGEPRMLIEFPPRDGQEFIPDGLIFDAAGRLYVATWNGGLINVVEVPSGKLLRQYDAGGLKATNCHFFGPYLYTTIAAKEAIFRLRLNTLGHDYTASK